MLLSKILGLFSIVDKVGKNVQEWKFKKIAVIGGFYVIIHIGCLLATDNWQEAVSCENAKIQTVIKLGGEL